MSLALNELNPQTPGIARVCNQQCGCWWPGAKAPSHQFPSCQLIPNITLTAIDKQTKITFEKKMTQFLRVKNKYIYGYLISEWHLFHSNLQRKWEFLRCQFYHYCGTRGCHYDTLRSLTHWGRDKMAAFPRTILSNAFSWMKILEFRLKIHWSLFLKVLLTIFQHWFW